MKLRIFKNENKDICYGMVLAVVAALNREQAHVLILLHDEYANDYYDIEDWEDTGLVTNADKPCIIAEGCYVE